MAVASGGEEGRTFRADFSSEGVEVLRERVKEKLKEYMGDYTDDTLVEYVIVLLKNGRSKEEARSELNVFLDEDSDSFISWLWDHLESNLNLYVKAQESHLDKVYKAEVVAEQQCVRNDSHNLESESEKVKQKSSRSRHNRLWKGIVRDAVEQPRLRSSVADNSYTEKGSHHKVSHDKRSISPQPVVHRKRNHSDEQLQNKREVVPQATVDAPRRLLQFAVRDAVAPLRPSNLTREPSLKRLRSVVSGHEEDPNIGGPPKRIRSVARVPIAMTAAIKAVAEAAKDVKRVRSSGNVFDRLGRASDFSDSFDQLGDLGEGIADKGEDGSFDDIRVHLVPSNDTETDCTQLYTENMSVLRSNQKMTVDPPPHSEKYDVSVRRQGAVNISKSGTSGMYKGEELLTYQGGVPYKPDDVINRSLRNQDHSGATSSAPSKLVSASANSNTWISPQYQETKESIGVDSWKNVHVNEATMTPSAARTIENNNHVVPANGTAKSEVILPKESQVTQLSAPGFYPISRPVEDADSRTVFVSNVHFAATKDSLLMHFNKFGEVLKVIILTDATTGQPKGSAYVEFMKKEAADSALSVDGTSFMSRILKVVKKNSAHPEASSIMGMPRISRGSPFPTPRYGRVAFQRGIPNMYRSRFSMKPGARSLQWKRDTQSTSGDLPSPASSNVPSTANRGLTYIRPEPGMKESTSAT